MTSPHGLPSILRTKLASLNRRIRLLQALRGGGLLVLAVVVLCGGLFLADLLLALSPQALRIAAAAILGVVALVTVFGLIVPLCRRIDLAALAALIEAQYPDLGERLTTTVELAETRDAWHGSRALIELLIEETEHRARPLDFTRAFPARLAGWMALAAVVAVLAAGLPALLWGNKYADFGNRLVGAWSPAPAATPSSPAFTFQVTPADTFAAKGRSLSLLVLVHPQTGSPATACNLAYTDSANKTVRTRMPAEPALLPALAAGLVAVAPANGLPLSPAANLLSRVRPGTRAFSYQIERLTGDLPFHIEVGEARSDTYKITAVEPVELVASSPTLTIDAPAYASKAVHPTQTLAPGSTPFAYEYGSIRLDCRFTRPAMRASLEIAPRSQDGRTTFLGASWRLPMPLQGDRQQASYEMPALHRGVYDVRLILEAEYGITTVHNIEALTIQHDEPPAFTRKPELAGVHATEVRRDWIVGADATGGQFNPVRGGLVADRAREVAPDDTLKLKITIEDTLGVDKVELEYRINDSPSRFEPIVAGEGRLRAEPPHGEYPFQLVGKVKEGDIVLYRLRASDNRQVAKGAFKDVSERAVPVAALAPHIVYYPERAEGKDRWFILRINRKADSFVKQEILAERDRLRQQLDAIQKKLTAERGGLNKLRTEARDRPQLSPEEQTSLSQLRRDNREIRNDLGAFARDAEQAPALHQLADTAQKVADKEMVRSEEALTRAAGKKLETPQRAQQLQQADEELARAQKQLDLLKQTNDKVAQHRLDQLRMENLANQQQELQRRAQDLATKNPMQDPQAKRELDELRAEQNQVADELRRLAEQSELFRDALNAARADAAKKLADDAKQLALAQRELAQVQEDAVKQETVGRFADLVRKQQELAAKVADLAKDTAQPAKLANKPPLKPAPAQQAAEAVAKGDLADAVQKQDQAAKELQRLAADFDKALAAAPAPMAPGLPTKQQADQARQLAQAQKELREAVQKMVAEALALRKTQPEESPLGELARKQRDVAQKAAELAKDVAKELGTQAPVAKQAQEAAQQAQQTAQKAQAGAMPQAQQAGQQLAEQLRKLAQALQQTPRGNADPKAPDPAQRAAQLAKTQDELNQQMQPLAGNTTAQKAQQEARQGQLAKQTGDLRKELGKFGQPTAPAAQTAQQAQNAMQQAQAQAKQGNAGKATEAARQAAQMLDKAAQQAAQAAQQMAGQKPGQPGQPNEAAKETGQAVQQGQEQVGQAQAKLGQGQPKDAQGAMQKAAAALQKAAHHAAQQMAKPQQSGEPPPFAKDPGPKGAAGTGLPDLSLFGKEMKKYTGRTWGDLPGELRTRILQDMRARYGEDYAGIIQRYFEQIADPRPAPRK